MKLCKKCRLHRIIRKNYAIFPYEIREFRKQKKKDRALSNKKKTGINRNVNVQKKES